MPLLSVVVPTIPSLLEFFLWILKFVLGLFEGIAGMLSNFVIYLVALKYYVLAVRDVFAIGFSTVPRAFIYLFVVTMTGTVIWRMFRSNWGA